MSVRNLNFLFRPKSVAVIGASERPHSVGATVMRNLLDGGFHGPIMAVNPRHGSIFGVTSCPNVESLPHAPNLAVICTPPATVPGLIAALGQLGTKAAVVLTAGISAGKDAQGCGLREAMLKARPAASVARSRTQLRRAHHSRHRSQRELRPYLRGSGQTRLRFPVRRADHRDTQLGEVQGHRLLPFRLTGRQRRRGLRRHARLSGQRSAHQRHPALHRVGRPAGAGDLRHLPAQRHAHWSHSSLLMAATTQGLSRH